MKKVITLLLAALMLMLGTAFAETTSLEDMYNGFLNAVSSEYAYQLAYELSTNPAYMNSTTHGGRQAGSDAEHAAAEYLYQEMLALGLEDVEKVAADCDRW